jgi:hypothetical protein
VEEKEKLAKPEANCESFVSVGRFRQLNCLFLLKFRRFLERQLRKGRILQCKLSNSFRFLQKFGLRFSRKYESVHSKHDFAK